MKGDAGGWLLPAAPNTPYGPYCAAAFMRRMFWHLREISRALVDIDWCTLMHPCEILIAINVGSIAGLCKLASCIGRLTDTASLRQHVTFMSTSTPGSA